MTRLSRLFEKPNREKLLSIFVTAGFPELDSTAELVLVLERAGADFVEIGMPFSDPMADGPTIQRSSEIALQNGVTLDLVLTQIQDIRKESEIPILLMSYLNPLFQYGMPRLLRDAMEVGVDGFIIPDLIPEETARLNGSLADCKLKVNFLISPNTPFERIRMIDRSTADFVYCVALTGVTGARQGVPVGLLNYLRTIRRKATRPLMVGFGIANPQDAAEIARESDGVVIGSAIIHLLQQSLPLNRKVGEVSDFVKSIKSALKGVENGH